MHILLAFPSSVRPLRESVRAESTCPHRRADIRGGARCRSCSSPTTARTMAVLPALRLYTSNASPYCLKVRARLALVLPSRALVLIALARSQVMVLAHELGLTPHIELD